MKRAAEGGHAAAMFILSVMHGAGEGTPMSQAVSSGVDYDASFSCILLNTVHIACCVADTADVVSRCCQARRHGRDGCTCTFLLVGVYIQWRR